MSEPRTVYVVTDAPPRTAHTAPSTPAPYVRLAWARACRAVAALLLVYALIPDAYGCRWWLYGAVLGWLVQPCLARLGAFAGLLFGAADALVTAMLGTRRLVYLAALLRQAVHETRTPRPTDDADRDDDDASPAEGDPS
ncbi:hypothetical protein AB0F17_17005 [Nonomuraea sp. NPDC026600]|uniref:hypothetical protein n=1 Tax=Nonomuraea sp. NPDC026600 TaxID=3155363 RepID=UPI0034051E82